MKFRTTNLALILATIVIGTQSLSLGQSRLEEGAIQQAVDRIALSVVQIETIGGVDRVEGAQINEGPTTGVILDEEGHVLSSLFNFMQDPSSIVVRFADGEIAPAEILARDFSRNLVILQVNTNKRLRPVELVKRSELSVGQTSIAIGKIYDSEQPNISVGILSALNRIWDRAVQTDAKISPANFGGPLIDLKGRMIGVLTPLSPESADVFAGSEWYDSGIGFAVPIQDLIDHFDSILKGADLRPGLLGVAFKGGNPFTDAPEISVCLGGPATKAGIRAGDIIIQVNGRTTPRQSELRHAVGRFYAGDSVSFTIERDGERLSFDVELTDRIEPFERSALGIIPWIQESRANSVRVRHVLSDSAAAKAGLKFGDSIQSVNGTPIGSREELALSLIQHEPGTTITLEIQRADSDPTQEEQIQFMLTPQSARPLENMERSPSAKSIQTIEINVADSANKCFAILPIDAPSIAGALVWIPEPGPVNQQEFVATWSPFCQQYNMVVLVPQSLDQKKWEISENEFIVKSLTLLMGQVKVDPNRVGIGGRLSGGAMAALTCFSARDKFRGLILIDSYLPPRLENPATSTVDSLLVFAGCTVEFDKQDLFDAGVERLVSAKFPVHVENAGSSPLADWIPKILGWVDTLDRL